GRQEPVRATIDPCVELPGREAMVLEDQRQMVRPEARIAGQERPDVHGADNECARADEVRVGTYQREVRGRPRLGPSRRPPPPLRSGDLASSTLTWRPSRSRPLKRVTASCASSAVAISTKPKPRDRPVPVSVTTVADSTTPAAAKTSRSRPRLTASMSAFGTDPSFRSIIVRLIVRRIPVTSDGKSNPAPLQSAIRWSPKRRRLTLLVMAATTTSWRARGQADELTPSHGRRRHP